MENGFKLWYNYVNVNLICGYLRRAFASWYDNGHTNEDDTNTIILRMKIIDGIIMSEGVKYEF